MMLTLIVAQLAVFSAAPGPSPEQALAILARLDSPSNWTNRVTCSDCDGPRVTIVPYRAGDGPFGPFPVYETAPLNCCSFYQVPIYRPAWYGIGQQASRVFVTSSARGALSSRDFRRSRRRR